MYYLNIYSVRFSSHPKKRKKQFLTSLLFHSHQCLMWASTAERLSRPIRTLSSLNLTTTRPWRSASKDNIDLTSHLMMRVNMGNADLTFIPVTWSASLCSFMSHSLYKCNFSLRACASAALKDVAAYFTKEQGQVAVSKRTTETVPLITIIHNDSLCMFSSQ